MVCQLVDEARHCPRISQENHPLRVQDMGPIDYCHVNLGYICSRCIIHQEVNTPLSDTHFIDERIVQWIHGSPCTWQLLVTLKQWVIVIISVFIFYAGS